MRQYYLREGANIGDIQVNLVGKSERKRKSHEIASAARPALDAIGKKYGGSTKIVEVPPGPPVQAPLVAEVYGPDYAGQQMIARELRAVFESTDDIVDIDDSIEAAAPRVVVSVDRNKAALLGVSQASVTNALQTALSGEDVAYVRDGYQKYPLPVRLELPVADKSELDSLLMLRVAGHGDSLVPLAEIVTVRDSEWEQTIYHKDLLPVVFVTGDMAGRFDSPLYGMFDMVGDVEIEQHFISQPDNPVRLQRQVGW